MQNGNEIYKYQNKNGWWPFWAAVTQWQANVLWYVGIHISVDGDRSNIGIPGL